MRLIKPMFEAAFLSPLVIVPTVFVVVPATLVTEIVESAVREGRFWQAIDGMLPFLVAMSFTGLIFGWIGTVFVGIPLYAGLRWAGLAYPTLAALIGAAIGLWFGFAFFSRPEPQLYIVTTVSGGIVAACFCHIANDRIRPSN